MVGMHDLWSSRAGPAVAEEEARRAGRTIDVVAQPQAPVSEPDNPFV